MQSFKFYHKVNKTTPQRIEVLESRGTTEDLHGATVRGNGSEQDP